MLRVSKLRIESMKEKILTTVTNSQISNLLTWKHETTTTTETATWYNLTMRFKLHETLLLLKYL